MSYIIETRTGNKVTRKLCENDICKTIDRITTDNFIQNYLPLNMLAPLSNISVRKQKDRKKPTKSELDEIEKENL